MEEHQHDTGKVHLLGWGEEETDVGDFTPVVSKSARKRLRAASKVKVGGARSKSSATSGKTSINHPLCDVLVGPRSRKQNPKYQ